VSNNKDPNQNNLANGSLENTITIRATCRARPSARKKMGRSVPKLMRSTAVLTSKIKSEKTVDNGHDLAEPSAYCAAVVVGGAMRFA
jgi:hypothetical protein